MSRQNLASLRRFKRCKTQAVIPVAPQEPLDRAVAQSAMAIEEDQKPIAGERNTVHTPRDAG